MEKVVKIAKVEFKVVFKKVVVKKFVVKKVMVKKEDQHDLRIRPSANQSGGKGSL